MQNQAKTILQPGRAAAMKKRWRRLLRSPLFDICQFLLLLLLFAWFFAENIRSSGYVWHWYQVPRYLFTVDADGFHAGPLLEGLAVTLQISGVSLLFAFVVGLIIALLRLSNSFVGRSAARVYLEIVRNTPLLIQIFFIYFVLGPVLGLNRFPSAVLALSLFEGAYASEIIRAGIVGLHRGQWEASYSLGLSVFDTYRCIILPQAIRRALPPLAGQAISLVKDSALVSTIAIYDLTMQAQAIIAETFLTFEIWFTVACMYLIITLSLSVFVALLERRFRMT
jgi:polar amino acid transport system permease protein